MHGVRLEVWVIEHDPKLGGASEVACGVLALWAAIEDDTALTHLLSISLHMSGVVMRGHAMAGMT